MGCESDAHDAPGRLESEVRIEECSAVCVSIRAIYVWNRVNGGVFQNLLPGCSTTSFTYLFPSPVVITLLAESPTPFMSGGENGSDPPIYVT